MPNQNVFPFIILQINTNEQSTSDTPISIFLESPILWIFTSIFIMILLIGIIAVIFYMKRQSKFDIEDHGGPGYSSNEYNVDNLKVCAMIGQGKFGTVWQGTLNEENVAVKIFPSQHRQYYLNEKDIYSLPFMDSPNLLKYYGM